MYNLSFAAAQLLSRSFATDPGSGGSPDVVGGLVPRSGEADPAAPGNAALGDLIATIRTWSIIACVIAIIIAAVLWAWGSQSQNAAQATQGKKGVIVAVAAAALIFAAEALVNWGIEFGKSI